MEVPLMVFAAALLGGACCWSFRWTERRLHVALALGTGTFLGAVFLHLLPEVAGRPSVLSVHASTELAEPSANAADLGTEGVAASDHASEEDSHGHGNRFAWLCVLLGVLLVHLVEAVFLRTTEREDESRHRSVSYVALAGVSVHAASAGLGLSALHASGSLGTAFLAAFLTHKAFESFALANVFLLARMSRPRIALVLFLFSLLTPACLLVGAPLMEHMSSGALGAVTALATGTFLYVCVGELLPEVFHHSEDNLAKFVFLMAGVALSVLLEGHGA